VPYYSIRSFSTSVTLVNSFIEQSLPDKWERRKIRWKISKPVLGQCHKTSLYSYLFLSWKANLALVKWSVHYKVTRGKALLSKQTSKDISEVSLLTRKWRQLVWRQAFIIYTQTKFCLFPLSFCWSNIFS
jgi:hypothetical protein